MMRGPVRSWLSRNLAQSDERGLVRAEERLRVRRQHLAYLDQTGYNHDEFAWQYEIEA